MATNRELGKPLILINGGIVEFGEIDACAYQLQQTLPGEGPLSEHFSFDHLRDSNALPMARRSQR